MKTTFFYFNDYNVFAGTLLQPESREEHKTVEMAEKAYPFFGDYLSSVCFIILLIIKI